MQTWEQFEEKLTALCDDFVQNGPGEGHEQRWDVANLCAQMAAFFSGQPGQWIREGKLLPVFIADQLEGLVQHYREEAEHLERQQRRNKLKIFCSQV